MTGIKISLGIIIGAGGLAIILRIISVFLHG